MGGVHGGSVRSLGGVAAGGAAFQKAAQTGGMDQAGALALIRLPERDGADEAPVHQVVEFRFGEAAVVAGVVDSQPFRLPGVVCGIVVMFHDDRDRVNHLTKMQTVFSRMFMKFGFPSEGLLAPFQWAAPPSPTPSGKERSSGSFQMSRNGVNYLFDNEVNARAVLGRNVTRRFVQFLCPFDGRLDAIEGEMVRL